MKKTTITSITTVSGYAGGSTGEAEVVLLVKGTSDTVEAIRERVAQASITPVPQSGRERNWPESLTIEAAQQDSIAVGDIVRSYDFPGLNDSAYVEGVAKHVEAIEDGRVLIHVTREVWRGVEVQVDRFEVWAPRGVSSLSRVPCLFLIAKREVKG